MIKWLRENVFYFLSKKKNEEEEAFVQIENYHSMEKIKKKWKRPKMKAIMINFHLVRWISCVFESKWYNANSWFEISWLYSSSFTLVFPWQDIFIFLTIVYAINLFHLNLRLFNKITTTQFNWTEKKKWMCIVLMFMWNVFSFHFPVLIWISFNFIQILIHCNTISSCLF